MENVRLSDRDALASMLAGEMPQSSTIVGILQRLGLEELTVTYVYIYI